MRWIPFILLVLVGALLEGGNLLNLVAVGDWHIRPAILIVLLVFFTTHCRPHEAIIASFIIGLGMDVSGNQMGPYTISYCLIGGLLNQLSDHFPTRRVFHQATVILAVYLVTSIVAYWLVVLKTGERQDYAYQIFLFTGLYSAVVGPMLWRPILKINRMIALRIPRAERGYLR
jgi:rod shape-determining protein MreD